MQSVNERQCSGVNGELSTISVTLMVLPSRRAGVVMPRSSPSVQYQY